MIVTRMCHVCRQKMNQNDLIRITKTENGFVVDNNKKVSGRAFYVCKNNDCILNLKTKRVLNRIYKTNFNDSVYDKIIEDISARNN